MGGAVGAHKGGVWAHGGDGDNLSGVKSRAHGVGNGG